MKVIDNLDDPVYVTPTQGFGLKLRIGEPKRGQTRYAILSTAEARAVAYALLYEAIQKDIELKPDCGFMGSPHSA